MFDRIPAGSDSYSRNDAEVMNAKVFISYNFAIYLYLLPNYRELTLTVKSEKTIYDNGVFATCRFLLWNQDLDCMDGDGLHLRYVNIYLKHFCFPIGLILAI